MKANELRIGNWVMHPCEGEWKWKFNRDDWDYCELEEFQPIPLTPEWLNKFGFDEKGYSYGKGPLSITMFKNRVTCIQFDDCIEGWTELVKDPPCKHVHQLQNLYFALTGNELTYKPCGG